MHRKLNYLATAIILSGLLHACGGGGGSGDIIDDGGSPDNGVAFTGVTSQAQVTETNAPEFVGASLTNGTAPGSSTSVVGVVTESDGAAGLSNPDLARLFVQIASAGIAPSVSTSVVGVVVGPVTENCSGGGTLSIEMDVNQSNGSFTGEVTLDGCVEGGQRNDGVMSFSGSYDLQAEAFDSALTFSFSALNITSPGTAAPIDITANGSMECDLTTIDTAFACTQDMDIRDNISGETFRSENLATVLSPTTGGSAMNITGNFYHPDHGYVEIVTNTDLVWADGAAWPSSGVIRLLGRSGSNARITVIDDTQYTLEVDSDGDAEFEVISLEDWPS